MRRRGRVCVFTAALTISRRPDRGRAGFSHYGGSGFYDTGIMSVGFAQKINSLIPNTVVVGLMVAFCGRSGGSVVYTSLFIFGPLSFCIALVFLFSPLLLYEMNNNNNNNHNHFVDGDPLCFQTLPTPPCL